MELVKQDLQENPLVKNLIPAIMGNGSLDVKRIDKVSLNVELRKYKNPNGSVNFPALFSIPGDKRIAAMSEKDLGGTIKIITVALTLCFETMNLSRPMSASQIVDLAEAIVDTSIEEDKPAFEDLMIFLQKLSRGEYPGLYEGIDIPKFMERFGMYRDDRWNEGIRLRDERDAKYKSAGDMQRGDRKMTAFEEHLSQFTTKISNLKDDLREERAARKRGA